MTYISQKFQKLWNDPYLKFIISFVGLYLILYYFNELYIGITAKGGIYISFLDHHLNYIKWWRNFSIQSTAEILRWLGHTVYTNTTQLKVIGKSGFTLVYSCLGYGVMSVFIAFCISFPTPFKHRYSFMLIGLIFIQALNTCRFIFLSLFWKKNWYFLGMDHHDLFNIVVYAALILICYLWIRFSSKNKNAQNPTQKEFR